MKQFGLLFKDGEVTAEDLGFLHTVPYMVACEALEEYFSLHPKEKYVMVTESLTTRKFTKKYKNLQGIAGYDYPVMNRLTDIITSARDLIRDDNLKSRTLYWIEQPMYRHTRMESFFEFASDVLSECEDYEAKNFISQEVIPFKLEDFHMSHPRLYGNLNTGKSCLNEMWDSIMETVYEEKYMVAEHMIEEFGRTGMLSDDIIVGIKNGLIPNDSKPKKFLEYYVGEDCCHLIDIKFLAESRFELDDEDEKSLQGIFENERKYYKTGKSNGIDTYVIGESVIGWIIEHKDDLHIKRIHLQAKYPLASEENLVIVAEKESGDWAVYGINKDNLLIEKTNIDGELYTDSFDISGIPEYKLL